MSMIKKELDRIIPIKATQLSKAYRKEGEAKQRRRQIEEEWNQLVNKRFKLLKAGSTLHVNVTRSNPTKQSSIITVTLKKIIGERHFKSGDNDYPYYEHTFLRVSFDDNKKYKSGWLEDVIKGVYE